MEVHRRGISTTPEFVSSLRKSKMSLLNTGLNLIVMEQLVPADILPGGS